MEIMTKGPDPYLPISDPVAPIPAKMLTGCHGEVWRTQLPPGRPLNPELNGVITTIRWASSGQKTVSKQQDCEAEGLRV